jgi:propionyl-CoA synthetase
LAPYEEVYRQSIEDPDQFWAGAGDAVEWIRRWDRVLDPSVPQFYRWFSGGVLNTCDNVLDRQIRKGRGNQTALIYDSPVTGTIRKFTFEALTREVSRCAGGLSSLGVQKGDRVVIYMPMVPEAVIAMLACARLGAIHSVVFGGFAARELASRLADATPKVIISASCGIEINRVIPYKPLLDQAVDIAKISPRACVILQRPELEASLREGKDIGWDASPARLPIPCTFSIPRERPVSRRELSGITGATLRPWSGA